ncbi:MAG: Grx4 family monothiol glutaredoxin [Oligoflexia bacterium]|nr:Grx4 family monothiol glutaredoxin [Oligoflexia bacterium]
MSIFNKIKRKLPVVGNGATASRPASPSPSASAAPGPAAAPEPASLRGDAPVGEFLAEFVKSKPVVLFMKGTPTAPMCGFSANAAGVLSSYGVDMAHFDVLSDPQVRQGIKEFSQWPTLPQVYVRGEFIGGSDILMQMHQSGELKELLDQPTAG